MIIRKARKKRRTAAPGERGEQILNAALEVFCQKGFSAATIPDIAEQAGVAAGTIYIYYQSKRELFIAVIEKLMVSPVLAIFQNSPGKDFPVTLETALRNRLELLQSDVMNQLPALISEIQRDPELKKLFFEKLIKPFLDQMEIFFKGRIQAGEFRNMNSAVAVRAMGGMMIGLIIMKSLEGETSPLNKLPKEQLLENLMGFIMHGLVADGRAPVTGGKS